MYYNTGSTSPPTVDADPGYTSVQRPSQPAAVTDTTYTSLADTTPADTQETMMLDNDNYASQQGTQPENDDDYIHPI